MRAAIRSLAAATVFSVLAPAHAALAKVRAKPDPSDIPRSAQGEQLVNGLYFWALLATLAGLFISILVYAVANRVGNHHDAQGGKVGILVMEPLAMVAGAGPAIINFFSELGQQVR
jgi:hypothetical protein